MSTRSTISALYDDGTVHSIYCHCDGYPSYNGAILNESYSTLNKVMALMELGDLSHLGHSLEHTPTDWDVYSEDSEKRCKTYKDRGETGVDALIYPNMSSFVKHRDMNGQAFNYLFKDNQWWLLNGSDWTKMQLLRDVLTKLPQ